MEQSTIQDKNKSLTDTNSVQLAGAGVGAGMLKASPKNILGYENLYHGTLLGSNAANIKKEGLKTSYGGTGVASNDKRFHNIDPKAEGKIYTTTSKTYAKHYTGPFHTGDVVEMKAPFLGKDKLYRDVVIDKLTEGDSIRKKLERAYNQNIINIRGEDIGPQYIKGSNSYKGVKQFLNKEHLGKYLKEKGGKLRFGKGVAQAVGGAALLGASAKGLYDNFTKKEAAFNPLGKIQKYVGSGVPPNYKLKNILKSTNNSDLSKLRGKDNPDDFIQGIKNLRREVEERIRREKEVLQEMKKSVNVTPKGSNIGKALLQSSLGAGAAIGVGYGGKKLIDNYTDGIRRKHREGIRNKEESIRSTSKEASITPTISDDLKNIILNAIK